MNVRVVLSLLQMELFHCALELFTCFSFTSPSPILRSNLFSSSFLRKTMKNISGRFIYEMLKRIKRFYFVFSLHVSSCYCIFHWIRVKFTLWTPQKKKLLQRWASNVWINQIKFSFVRFYYGYLKSLGTFLMFVLYSTSKCPSGFICGEINSCSFTTNDISL